MMPAKAGAGHLEEVKGPAAPEGNPAVEESVVGGLLLYPDTLDEVRDVLHPEDFAEVRYRRAYQGILAVADRGGDIDPVTVCDAIGYEDTVQLFGGFGTFANLSNQAPRTRALMARTAEIIRDHSLRRRVYREAVNLQGDAGEADFGELVTRLETVRRDVETRSGEGQIRTLGEVLDAVHAGLQRTIEAPNEDRGIPTGLVDLDNLTGRWKPGQLIVVAGRPGMGKTAFALTVAWGAVSRGHKVGMFSLEMLAEELGIRLVASEGHIDGRRLQSGDLRPEDWGRYMAALDRFEPYRDCLLIDDAGTVTTSQLRARARRLVERHRVELLLVDYLQIVSPDRETENRTRDVTSIARGLKAMAKELRVPVIALGQLNRNAEGRNTKRPGLADLRESGAIEQEADKVLLLYRDEVYHEDTEDKGVAEVIVAKQRSLGTGTVKLAYVAEETRFGNLERRYEDDGDGYRGAGL